MFSLLSIQSVQAQEINIVMEISWYAYGINNTELMVTYTNKTGVFTANHYLFNIGNIQTLQNVRVKTQCDGWGNCTTYLYGCDAVSDSPVAYSPDNFVICKVHT